MSCCSGVESVFDERTAERDLRRYRRFGPTRSTRLLTEALVTRGVAGASLIDIGGGVGAVQHALLKAGVHRVVAVDASSAYLSAAREEAERQGRREYVTYHQGDFVELAGRLEPADAVTMDRVICCYEEMPALVSSAAGRARRLCGLVYPRDTWWNRVGLALVNLALTLLRRPFRVYLHPPAAVDETVREGGFEKVFERDLPVWRIALYQRPVHPNPAGGQAEGTEGRRSTSQERPWSTDSTAAQSFSGRRVSSELRRPPANDPGQLSGALGQMVSAEARTFPSRRIQPVLRRSRAEEHEP